MNTHLLKLIWNRRKDYIWIFIEQLLVFVVLFYCFTEIYSKLEQYLDPGNLNTKNVCSLGIMSNEEELKTDQERADFWEKYKYLDNKVRESKYVEAVHEGYASVPGNRPASNNSRDSLEYKGKKYSYYIKTSDGNLQKVFRIQMLEGTWFKDEVMEDGAYPVVFTKSLVEKLGISEPVGVKFNSYGRDFRVVGVMNDYKSFIFDDAMPAAIFAKTAFEGSRIDDMEMAILIKEGQMQEFISYFWKEAQKIFPNTGHQFTIYDLGKGNKEEELSATISLLISVIPTLFLTIFAFLGTFSLMYRQTRKNYSEYGLRMALGSTKNNLKRMVLGQSTLLTGIAALLGCVVAINLYLFVFPEISLPIAIGAIISVFVLMLLFSLLSVWYPAYSVSNIQPAIALKQEE